MVTSLQRFSLPLFVLSIISLTLLYVIPAAAMDLRECQAQPACAERIGGQLQSFLTGQGEGFYPASEASGDLQKLFNKTYVIVMGVTTPFTVDAKGLEKIKEQKKMHVERGVLLPELMNLVPEYVNDDLAEQCELNSKDGTATCLRFKMTVACAAFATNKGSRMWTAQHCINTWLKNFKNDNLSPPKAFIYSIKGELVAGPLDLQDLGLSLPFKFEEGLSEMKHDYFEISLAKPVANFFEILSDKETATSVVAIGFPTTTGVFQSREEITYRTRRDNLNAADNRLMYSRGVVLDPLAVHTAFSRSEVYAPYVDTLLDSRLRISSADVVPGMSGGPMIDLASGKVVGVVTGGLWSVILEGAYSASVAVRPPGCK